MSQKNTQLIFFALLAIGLSIILFFIFKPYLGVLFFAAILAVSFRPLYKSLLAKFRGRKNLASLAATLLIFIFIIVPIVVISALLLKEAVDLYNRVAFGGAGEGFISQANILIGNLNNLFPAAIWSNINLGAYLQDALNWIIGNFGTVFTAIFGSILNFLLMIISLYYLFVYGDKIKESLIFWSPLPDRLDLEFMDTLKASINSVLQGRILVALIQGAFIGLGFALFGIGSPVLWSFVGAVASLVPLLGTSIVTIPAIAYLFLNGSTWAGVGLLFWSAVAVGLVDNFISAAFLKGRIKVHPLIILFSILGGVEVFGAIGFLVGPVAVSALLALLRIYPLFISSRPEQT